MQESYTYFIQGGVIETVGDGDADARVSFTDCLYDGQNTDNGKTGFYGARGFVGTNSGHADFTRCLLDPAGAVTTLTYLGANFCPGGDNVSITDCYYTQPYGPAQGTDATGMSAADLAAALGSAWTVSEGHARPRLMRNALDETNTVFGAVQIVGGTPTGVTTSDGVCTFLGTYDPVVIGASGDRHKLYLGAANTLYYPNAAMTIGAFRAYFQLNGATASPDPSQGGGNEVRAFRMTFDGEETGITTTNYTNGTNPDGAWYTLDGRRLSGKPTKAGIYVNNGRKIVIK